MTYKTCIKGQICVWNWCTFKFKVNLKDEFDRVSTPLGQKKKICLFPDRPGFESTDLHSNWRPKFFSSVKIRKYWIKTISASLSFCIEMLKQLPLVAKAIPFLCFLNWGRPKLIGKKKKKKYQPTHLDFFVMETGNRHIFLLALHTICKDTCIFNLPFRFSFHISVRYCLLQLSKCKPVSKIRVNTHFNHCWWIICQIICYFIPKIDNFAKTDIILKIPHVISSLAMTVLTVINFYEAIPSTMKEIGWKDGLSPPWGWHFTSNLLSEYIWNLAW